MAHLSLNVCRKGRTLVAVRMRPPFESEKWEAQPETCFSIDEVLRRVSHLLCGVRSPAHASRNEYDVSCLWQYLFFIVCVRGEG